MRRMQRRKRPLDYLLPFLILISVGVIIVLGFQLVMNWGKQGKGDVYFYVAEGKAKILPYGNTDWDNAFSGTKLLLGDSLKTSYGSKVVMNFFNGTIIRMDEDTAVALADVEKTSDKEIIAMNLDNGKVWVNGNKSAGVREAVYEVRTKNMKVLATGTVFDVESDTEQIVRVFDGEVEVDILINTNGQERVADTIPVGVGQELYLDEAAINAFAENKSPSLLSAVNDEFKTTAWYRWNTKEDSNPTDFSLSTHSGDLLSEDGATPDAESDMLTEDEEDSASDEEDSTDIEEEDLDNNPGPSTPEILEPRSTTTDTGKLVISGTVGSGVEKVVVESEVGGVSDSYTLSAFKAGDSVWSYNVAENYGNIKKGDNTYKVYAYDEEGNKSKPAVIVITYGDDGDSVEVEGDLSDPKVLTYNGSSSSEIDTDTVKVVGEIFGAAKVVVNGYTLSKFSPGDTTWSYIASESLGNLKPGENTFEVYGEDPDGNKTSVVEFTVTYNKSGADTSGETTPDSTGAAAADSAAETADNSDTTQPASDTSTGNTSDLPYGF